MILEDSSDSLIFRERSLHPCSVHAIIMFGFDAAVAELADALDSKSSGSHRAGSSPASGSRSDAGKIRDGLSGVFV